MHESSCRLLEFAVSSNKFFMTVPGVITSIGGTLTAVLYIVLAPLAAYCSWKKFRGESLLDTLAFEDLSDQDQMRHLRQSVSKVDVAQ